MGNILKICSWIFFLISFGILCRVLLLHSYPDFTVYYYSAQNVLHGLNPYVLNPQVPDVFLYPPFALAVFIPFTILPLLFAGKLFTIFSIILLLVSLGKLYYCYKISFTSQKALLLSAFVFLSFPVRFTLGMGQINIVILFLLTYFFTKIIKGEQRISGISLGAAYAMKLFPLLICAFLLYKKEWKVVAITSMTFLLLCLVSLICISPSIASTYFLKIISISQAWPTAYYNQAISGLLSHLSISNGREIIRFIITVIMIGVTGWIIYRDRKNASRRDLHIGSIIILSLLINPFSWQHHFVVLIIPFITLVVYIARKKNNMYYYLLLLPYVLISSNLKHPESVPGIIQSHVFWGTLFLLVFILYVIYKKNE